MLFRRPEQLGLRLFRFPSVYLDEGYEVPVSQTIVRREKAGSERTLTSVRALTTKCWRTL